MLRVQRICLQTDVLQCIDASKNNMFSLCYKVFFPIYFFQKSMKFLVLYFEGIFVLSPCKTAQLSSTEPRLNGKYILHFNIAYLPIYKRLNVI